MILTLLKSDNPILRQKSEPITVFDSGLKELVDNLKATALSNKGCVGISAVQCGVLKRVCLVSKDGTYFKALINPAILKQDGCWESKEGCLSLPGMTVFVMRPKKVLCQYQDLYGNIERMTCEGLLAAVVDHELNHLDGILMKDKSIKES